MIAIVIASVAFGILISAELGFMPKSNAQTALQTQSGATAPAVTVCRAAACATAC